MITCSIHLLCPAFIHLSPNFIIYGPQLIFGALNLGQGYFYYFNKWDTCCCIYYPFASGSFTSNDQFKRLKLDLDMFYFLHLLR